MSLRHGRTVGFALLAGSLLLSGGCGGKLYRVSGTVRANGRPVSNLIVHFVPPNGRPSSGQTDAAGAYKLFSERDVEGAVPGEHKVYVTYRPRDPREENDIQRGKYPPELKTVLAKYGNREKSSLRYEVTRDGQTIDLDLD